MIEMAFRKVSEQNPLVHCITNYVTVNDCANVLLAAGASPIMADDIDEMEDITAICKALVLNIGTLNARTVRSMVAAGKKANLLGNPVVFDPVGVGASPLRNETTARLLRELRFAVIRGNISEMKALAGAGGSSRGVDADTGDAVTEENLERALLFAKTLSANIGSVIVITGAIDIVADASTAYVIRNGHPMMSRVTGTGCMLTALLGAYAGAIACPGELLPAMACAVSVMGLCGEIAYEKIEKSGGGTGTFRMLMMDALSGMNAEILTKGMKVERRV